MNELVKRKEAICEEMEMNPELAKGDAWNYLNELMPLTEMGCSVVMENERLKTPVKKVEKKVEKKVTKRKWR